MIVFEELKDDRGKAVVFLRTSEENRKFLREMAKAHGFNKVNIFLHNVITHYRKEHESNKGDNNKAKRK
jgi:hypothetical protein